MTIHSRIRIGALAACLCLSGVAAAAESAPADTSTALTKLQNLTSRASELAIHAMGMIGIRYKLGGNVPESGLDCSGLVRYLFKEVWGADLPRTSEEISQLGQSVDTQNLQPGDLVFYNTLRRSFSHVGIYLGDNKFIHAPSAGGKVRIESMDLSYWKKRFNGARRINEPEQR
jgi:cell wall-associated NlpC family hydrolase